MSEPSPHDDRYRVPGPFRVEDIKPKSHYELSEGHPILVMPTGGQRSHSQRLGATVLGTDPDAAGVGVDPGYSFAPNSLRAPDIGVGHVPNEPGWIKGVPPLAVEYADVGQDEGELKLKISELLRAGTRLIWVVRLTGPRRVEVYERDRPVATAYPGSLLEAPGILRNKVLVESLYSEEAANAAALRNLVQRRGYESFEDVIRKSEATGEAKGKAEGLADALLALLESRSWQVSDDKRTLIRSGADVAALQKWFGRALTATRIEDVWT